MSEMKYKLPILIYDAQCTLCTRFKISLEKLSTFKDLSTVSIHEEDIYIEFPDLNMEECHQEIHLITEEAVILKGSKVIEYLLKQNPTVSKFSWLIESNQGQKTINYFYNMANKYRETLIKKCTTCNNKGHR